MLRKILHRLVSLCSSGRKRKQPASAIDAFPIYESGARAAPKVLPDSGELDLAATRLISEPQPRELPRRPDLSSTGHPDATRRLPWPARDGSAGQHPSSPRASNQPLAPFSAGKDDPTILVGDRYGRATQQRKGAPAEVSGGADETGNAPRQSRGEGAPAPNSDATILVTARKRPLE